MSWFKIDDKAHSHPKVVAAGNAAYGLWARLGAWASDYGTDGHLPQHMPAAYGTRAEVKRLLDVGLLDHLADGSYEIHDFLDYNPSAAEVASTREARSEAGKRGGMASAKRRGKQQPNSLANAKANASANGKPSPTPDPDPDPDPSTSRQTTTTTCTPVAESSVVVEDDLFDQAVDLVVDGIQARTKVQRPRAWRKSTRANVVTELGPAIRLAIDLGHTPEQAAAEVSS